LGAVTAAVLALGAPGVASAAPLVIADNTNGDEIQASASDGMGHEVTVSFDGGSYKLHDAAGVVSRQPSCIAVDPTTVSCPPVGIGDIEVRTGAGDDTITFASMQDNDFGEAIAGPGNDLLFGSGSDGDQLHGGSGADRIRGLGGNDALYGEVGADRLNGGPGKDFLSGGGGPDFVQARDGERDQRVLCGAGNDHATLDPIDVSHTSPRSC
jgi:hypothetical protein